MIRLLTSLFLRLYAFNLERRFRSAPAEACADALTQVTLLLVLPLWMVFVSLASWLRANESAIRVGNLSFIVFAVVVLTPVISWLLRKFAPYRKHPDAAERFRSPRERRKSLLIFLWLPVALAVALVLAHRSWYVV